MIKIFKKIPIFLLLFFVNFNIFAFSSDTDFNLNILEDELVENIEMVVGDIHVFKADLPTRVSIRNPEIVDVQKISEKEIVVVAKSKGITYFVFWDKHGKHHYQIRVFPEDIEYINSQVVKIIKTLGFSEVYTKLLKEEGRILILGKVDKFEDKERLKSALGNLYNSVVDLTEVKIGKIVEITAEVLELKKGFEKSLGIKWPSSIILTEPENRWNRLSGVPDALFRISDWTRETFSATIDFLVTQGKARILSRPYLLCESGKEAELMIGGEVPIFSTTAIVGGATGTKVEYKEYGIKLKISPVVKEDSIQLNLNVEVSDVGQAEEIGSISSGVGTSQRIVTARAYPISKRNISTQLSLKENQVLIIGGLIKQKTEEELKKLPWLSEVPVLGSFFRSSKKRLGGGDTLEDTELVVTLTPRIVEREKYPSSTQITKVEKEEQDLIDLYKNTNFPRELQDYIFSIQKKVSNNIVYPFSLINTGWEGVVVVRLNLEANGSLKDVKIVRSSGYKIFDDEAIKLIKSLSYDPFPINVDLKELNIDIPLVYRENR